jgi:tetratricopeptide (TPR) repeat protein
MCISLAGRLALLSAVALIAFGQATSAQVYTRHVVGSRVFGPPPSGLFVSGTISVGHAELAVNGFDVGPGFAGGYGYRPYYLGAGYGYPWYGRPYGYRPPYFGYRYYRPWGWGYWPGRYAPYGWYRPYFAPPLVLPPVFVPAEELGFGPAAAARMLGLVPAPVGAPLRPELIGNGGVLVRAPREAEPAFVSNAAARQRATKFMELGDGYFAQGNYVLAYERYKSAVQATPDLVEPYLRRGQALIAMESYDLALTTYKHAFKLHPNWANTNFRLDALYGNRQRDKQNHLDTLAAAAERQPTADLMFLVATQLLYDGQAERALRFFERAKELHQGEALPLPAIAEKAAAAPADPAQLAPVAVPADAPRPAPKKRQDEPALF